MRDIKKEILEMLADICDCDEIPDNPDMELLESNVLDSLSFILLLNRLDDEYDIEIQPTQVALDVFKTPNTIAAYAKKLADS